MTSRDEAWALLQRIEEKGEFATTVLRDGAGDGQEDRFVRTIVLGVLRWRSLLDALIESLAERPIKKIDQRVVQILRIGIFQLLEMNAPAYAAISETVELAGRQARRAKGFVNAVLRKASTTDLRSLIPPGNGIREVAVRLAHPPWMLQRWRKEFGEARMLAIAQANQRHSFPDLLVNTQRWTVDAAAAELTEKGVAFERSELSARALKLSGSTRELADLIEGGFIYPMDEGSMAVASLVPSNADTVLDLAAAPGGKSLAMALDGRRVISHDLSLSRLLPLKRTAQRFGLPVQIATGNGELPPFVDRSFDVVLLDAPCSATGTLRKSPEIKWRLTESMLPAFAELQRRLLARALDLTRSECIYSTCSLEPEENQHVVDAVLSTRTDFERADIAENASGNVRAWIEDGILHLTPESGADGFTAIRLRRRA